MSVIDSFLESVGSVPKRLAVVAQDGDATFAQLNTLSSRVASALEAAGFGRGDKIAMVLGNDEALRFTTAYLGISRIGAIPVPLNVRWAMPEKYYVLEHSDAVGIIVGQSQASVLADLSKKPQVDIEGRQVALKLRHFWAAGENTPEGYDSLDAVLAHGSTDHHEVHPGPNDPCDLLYTSGTTGMPKGVLTHQVNVVGESGMSINQVLGPLLGDRLLHAVPLFGFTGCHGVMITCLRGGLTQIAMPKFDPEKLLTSIPKYKVTSIMGVPTMLNLAVSHPKAMDYDYSSLQFVFFGAAAIQPDTIRKMIEMWPDVKMLNGYGLTEGGTVAACVLGPDPREMLNRPGCVGIPVNNNVVILDAEGKELGVNEIGEICFKPVGRHREYYKGEDRTQDLWRGGVLHTGDVGYVNEEGYVYITDRIKDMINRGGYNIYAIEVERVLLDLPEVLEVAVVGVPHPMLGEDVLAVVVPAPGAKAGEGALDPKAIYEYCKKHLADYKCPRHVVFADELPKNAMGKILKTDIRQKYHDIAERGKAAQAAS